MSAEKSLFLFELIVGDLHWSALQVGALGLMASAAAAGEGGQGFTLSRHLIHDDTSVMRLALRFAVGVDLSGDLRNLLDRLYVDVQQSIAQLKPFMNQDKLTQANRDLMRRLLPSLRRVALAASDVIARMEPHYRGRINPNFVADAATIRQFLARAARGDRADVAPDGSVRLPQLRQRRKSPRLSVRMPCLLALPGGEVEATLVDVSREGLGLRCDSPVAGGQRVAVVIGGRRLEAVVMRIEGDLVGVKLAKPMMLSDPLFKGG